jgi:hypothetical protein
MRACGTLAFSTARAVPLFLISYATPFSSRAAVILPVSAGSRPVSIVA